MQLKPPFNMLLCWLNVVALCFVDTLLAGNRVSAEHTERSTVATLSSSSPLPSAEVTHLVTAATSDASEASSTTAKEEETQSFDESFATTSFGIRSFTVEVTTASEKPQLFQLHDNTTKKTPTNLNVSKVKAVPSKKLKSSLDFKASTQATPSSPPQPHGDGNKVTVRADSMELKPKTVTQPPAPSGTTASGLQSNSQLNEKTLINDIHVEQQQQQQQQEECMLKNGLYRIKIAEIITDEFDNGLGEATENDVKQRLALSGAQNKLYNDGKINIADLYPSKLEDFSPIIRQSNEKLINDKHVFVMDDGNDDYKPYSRIELEPSNGSINSAKSENIPTTKIEIQLIDPDIDRTKTNEKVTDFTNQLLQDNDNFINTIERSFVNAVKRNNAESVPAQTSYSINKPINSQTFIERRVKKNDQSFRTQFDVPAHPDVSKLKINQDLSANHKVSNDTVMTNTNEKPEFSTTKFYNSKELYSELLHKKIPEDEISAPLTKAAVVTSTTTPRPLITLTTVIPSILSKASKKPIKSKYNAKDKSIAMLKTMKLPTSTTMSSVRTTSVPPTEFITVVKANAPTTLITTTTAKSVTDTTKRPTPFVSVTPSATTSGSLGLQTAAVQTKAFPSRPRVVSRLQDKINSLECDMQNELIESNVWRGNETHELCLPNTVSLLIILSLMYR